MIDQKALGKTIAALTPQLAEVIVENIKNKVDNVDLGTQSVDSSVGYQYNISDEQGQIQITVESGSIQGTQTVDVSEHQRAGAEVRAHERKYEDKRVFKLPNGEYITSETIPSVVLEQLVLEAVSELELK